MGIKRHPKEFRVLCGKMQADANIVRPCAQKSSDVWANNRHPEPIEVSVAEKNNVSQGFKPSLT
uniref:Uncharacterized protein n=1 Tax=Romanomermis culicivorax TaxID=13658 RepID=A0A915HUS5_ROMCU